MAVNAFVIHLLQNADLWKGVISIGEIKMQIIGHENLSSNDVIDHLIKKGYATIQGNRMQITTVGKSYIATLQQKELESIQKIIFTDYDLALISFLYERNDYVKLEDFPDIFRTMAPQYRNAVNNGNLLHALFRLKPYLKEYFHWYIINDTGKAFYQQRNPNKSSAPQINGSSFSPSSQEDVELEIPELTEPERIWLTELYNMTIKGERFTHRSLRVKLNSIIPDGFKTDTVDDRLMSSDGATIRILGVVALEGNYRIIEQINLIVKAVRRIVLNNAETKNVTLDQIAEATGFSNNDISVSLELARYYLNLYQGSSYKDAASNIMSIIDVSGSDEIFYNYLHFKSIEYYIRKAPQYKYDDNEQYFTKPEQQAMNGKLDRIIEILKEISLSEQFTYDDVMEELDEMRGMFGLKKKNWKRLLRAKVSEMVAGGVVSSVLAEPIADEIKPVLNKLLE